MKVVQMILKAFFYICYTITLGLW